MSCFYNQNSTHCHLSSILGATSTNSDYVFVKLLRNFLPTRIMFLRTGFVVSRRGSQGHGGCNLTATFFRKIWAVFPPESLRQLTSTNSGYLRLCEPSKKLLNDEGNVSEDWFCTFLWGSRRGNRAYWGCNLTATFSGKF